MPLDETWNASNRPPVGKSSRHEQAAESLQPGWGQYLGIHRQRANDTLIEVNAAPPSSRAGGGRLSGADLCNSASALAVVDRERSYVLPTKASSTSGTHIDAMH